MYGVYKNRITPGSYISRAFRSPFSTISAGLIDGRTACISDIYVVVASGSLINMKQFIRRLILFIYWPQAMKQSA